MSLYSYKLNKKNIEESYKNLYKEKDLRLMTTFQLREICSKEKLVKSIVNPLDKEELIRLIMKYRGEKEHLIVNGAQEGGLDRVEQFLKCSKIDIYKDKNIDYPGKITIYDGLSVEIYDDYILKCDKELEESNVILVDDKYRVCTILSIKKVRIDDGYKYFLVKDADVEARESESKHYSLLFLHEYDSELIYDVYNNTSKIKEHILKINSFPILQFEIKKLNETTIPLAIDFGTSNTTAGIYIDKEIFLGLDNIEDKDDKKIKLVEVLDSTKREFNLTPLIPSVVGVREINDGKVDYLFGYDAMEQSRKRYLDDGLTIFYDIKRWISDFDKSEKVIDINESTAFIKRKDIIKAFLLHVISIANQRFKCRFKNIYISCPSKQKFKFYSLFKDILSDYTVKNENILEESVAVLFNTISDLIERKSYRQGEEYKALIIDCGGGTTDLSGCTFSIRNNRVSYELNIETSYENGDTDFGGNNLTFRIMQFIKILMANAVLKGDTSIEKAIIDEFKIDIFRFVDKNGLSQLYETLNEEYNKAEEIIPTKFKLYESRSKEDYCKVRSNYYFLFDLAEEVKKLFFSRPEILKVILTANEVNDNDEGVIKFDKWKMSYYKNNILKVIKEAPSITLNTYQISTLIKGDVYNIIKKFLETLYENNELYDYSLIKLTGQSCKVDIFKDALKEFIPGRIIEINKTKKEVKEEYELKLACIKGTLKYLYARNFGYADINIESRTPTLPYLVTAYTHTGEQKELIKGKEIRKGFISRFKDKLILKLYLRSSDYSVKYEYNYSFNRDDLVETDARSISDQYPNISQPETDNIENDEVKFFVWVDEKLWGFFIIPVLRENDVLYIGNEKFFYFENDKWEKNFFDGMK